MTPGLALFQHFFGDFDAAQRRAGSASWWTSAAGDGDVDRIERRVFFDPDYLRSVQRAQTRARLRQLAPRLLLLVALAVLGASFAAPAHGEDGSGSDAPPPEEPTSDPDGWWDWLLAPCGDEGGTIDPESGTE